MKDDPEKIIQDQAAKIVRLERRITELEAESAQWQEYAHLVSQRVKNLREQLIKLSQERNKLREIADHIQLGMMSIEDAERRFSQP